MGAPNKVDPRALKIVKQSAELFVLRQGGEPIKTPGGHPVAYTNRRLLQQIVRELKERPVLESTSVDTYMLFSVQKDLVEKGIDQVADSLVGVLHSDPLLIPICRGRSSEWTEESTRFWSPLHFLRENNLPVPSVSASKRLPEDFIDLMHRSYLALSPAQRTVIMCLWKFHHAGLFMPLMLVLGRCTASEYEHAVDAHIRRVCTIDREWIAHRVGKSALNHGATIALEYLTYVENYPVLEVVKAGESMIREFKSSMRWNFRASRRDVEIEHAWLRTMAAFLNTDGGVLLIGVNDKGEIVGIDADGFENEDKYQVHFWTRVRECLGLEAGYLIRGNLERVRDKRVLLVECMRSPEPIYLKFQGEEEFCVRTGPRTIRLGIKEAVRWISDHFSAGRGAH